MIGSKLKKQSDLSLLAPSETAEPPSEMLDSKTRGFNFYPQSKNLQVA